MASRRRTQYQVQTSGFENRLEPGKSYESPWHQSWSEPVRKAVIATALIAAACIAPPFEDTQEPGQSYESQHHQPWSEPVRSKPGLATNLQQFLAQGEPPGPTVTSVVPASGPTIGGTTVLITGTNFVDGLQQLDPTKTASRITLSNGNLAATYNTSVVQNYASSGAVYSSAGGKRYLEGTATATVDPGNCSVGFGTTATLWTGLAGSWLGNDTSSLGIYSGFGIFSNNTDLGGTEVYVAGDIIRMAVDLDAKLVWYAVNGGNWNASPTADPAAATGGISYAAQLTAPGPYFPGVTITDLNDTWTLNFGKSAYSFTPPAGFQNWQGGFSVFFNGFPAASFTVVDAQHITAITPAEPAGLVDTIVTTVFGTSKTGAPDTFLFYDAVPWFTPLSEPSSPVKQKISLSANQQQSLAWSPFTPAAVVTGTGIVAASPVDIGIQFPQQTQYQAYAAPITTVAAETITVDKWFAPWREPVRQKAGLSAQLQQFFAEVLEPNTQIIQTFESRWHYAWSEPVRQKPGLGAIQQQSHVEPATGEVVTIDKWTYWWSEPVRSRQLPVSQQQSFTAGFEDTQEPGSSYESPWHQPWSEPARTRQLAAAQQQSLAFQLDPNTQIIQGFESRWHYAWSEPTRTRQLAAAQQSSHTEPTTSVFETVTADKWIYPWSEPVRSKPGLGTGLQQFTAQTVLEPNTQIIQTEKWFAPWREPVRQKAGLSAQLQQFFTETLEPNTQLIQTFESRWHQPWSEPVRQKPGLSAAQQQAVAAPAFTPPSVSPTGTGIVSASPVDIGIQYPQQTQYQGLAYPIFFTTEAITVDKWFAPFREPVRQKPGLAVQLQQFFAEVLNPETQIIQGFESRWHFAWSEPVRVRPQVPAGQQQAQVQGPVQTPEFVTVDKWFAWLGEPVKQKSGLTTQLQQFFAEVLEPNTQIIQTYESRWHFAWSEPVRVRQLATAQQQTVAQGEPTFEVINVDKWTYPWREPVRSKPGLSAGLQQFTAQTVLEPNTQIIQTYESRWHFAWSEPVRVKPQVPASQQQAITWTPIVAETVSIDKFGYAWSEPIVKQKIGLSTGSQQSFTTGFEDTLEPGTGNESPWQYPWSEPVRVKPALGAALQQFYLSSLPDEIQPGSGYESPWHYPWSEPVRVKPGLSAHLQQAFTTGFEDTLEPGQAFEPWFAPFTDPVRQKPGLAAPLQQALIATTLDPNTQITQTLEPRWHFAWSEPVRQKPGLAAGSQQAATWIPIVAETVSIDKFGYPWRDPVRQKPGLSAGLQQAFIGLTLEPQTQIIQTYESRWHFAWSEPVRVRPQVPVSQQQAATWVPVVAETVSVDKFGYPWSEPIVKAKAGLRTGDQQFYAADTLVIPTSKQRWFAPWREPVRTKPGLSAAAQQFFTTDTQTVIRSRLESLWHFPWSEPVRQKIGLRADLQQTLTPAVPPFQNLQRTIPWFAWLREPVRLKLGLPPWLQQFFTAGTKPISNLVDITLSATETNSDSALFGIAIYNAAVRANVSVVEIPAISGAATSIEATGAVVPPLPPPPPIPPPSNALTTEGGDQLTTEGGDVLTP